jgi:uncharacterized protein RhaS with RHS repeats
VATALVYDEFGEVWQQTSNTGVVQHTYDRLGRLRVKWEASAPPAGHKTTYDYDANGNLTTTTDFVAEVKVDPATKATTATVIQDDGKPLGITRLDVTTYEYDALNRVVKVTDPYANSLPADQRTSTQYVYDAGGRLTAVYDREKAQSPFPGIYARSRQLNYDPLGRLTGDVWFTQSSGTNPFVYDSARYYANDSADNLVLFWNAGTDKANPAFQLAGERTYDGLTVRAH